MAPRYDPPSKRLEWYNAAQRHGVDATSIYELDVFHPGSEIEEKQFLSLRIIWKETEAKNFNPQHWGLDVTDARWQLQNLPDWVAYTAHVQSGLGNSPSFGRYDLLWAFQKQIDSIQNPRDGPSKIRSPIVLRYRDPLNKVRYAEPGTPTPASRTVPLGDIAQVLENLGITGEELSPDLPLSPNEVYISPRSPVSAENSDQFPPADDEQTVNAALILLLKAVCLNSPSLSTAWTMERKAFVFRTRDNKDKVYEARTDGHLWFNHASEDRSLAILEVKASLRIDSEPEMQESAQMAAWIRSEPDQPTQDGTYRRLMISQDRHEIFLIIAEYDDDYITYITTGDLTSDPLLTMRRIGPFEPTATNHMGILGACLHAFTSRLLTLANQGQPCRW